MAVVYLIVGGLAVLIGGGSASMIRSRRRRARRYAEAARIWEATGPDDRAEALRQALDRDADPAPLWYLLGACRLRAGDARGAARAFGMAHHGDHTLESAALLTFACLKSVENRSGEFVEQAVRTWLELKRPAVIGGQCERALLECLGGSTREAPGSLTQLGRLIWCVGSESDQLHLERCLKNGSPLAAFLR